MEPSSPPRASDHPVSPLFVSRWSPRAFDASNLDDRAILTVLEAARWAPSCYNEQPWRFCYAARSSTWWQPFLATLMPFNREWAQHASALIFVLSVTTSDRGGEPQANPSHSFDAGAAWAHLALQASISGLVTRAMRGFNEDAARTLLEIPDNIRIEAAVALGRQGSATILDEALQNREFPSPRRLLRESVTQGPWLRVKM